MSDSSKDYSYLFPGLTPGSPTPATPQKMAGIMVSLPIGDYDTGIKIGKQNEHIEGSTNYKPGKSIVSVSLTELQSLINDKAGTGRIIAKTTKEFVNFGKVIGKWKDAVTGEEKETANGMIIYSNNGAHVVPTRP